MFVIYLWLAFIQTTSAVASNSSVNSSTKDPPVGWRKGGNDRGTWDIISYCLVTIIACTYSILHLNVPNHAKGSACAEWWSSIQLKLKWAIITILFPELITIHASLEFSMAFMAFRKMMKLGEKHVELPWWWYRSWPELRKATRELVRSLWSTCCRSCCCCLLSQKDEEVPSQKEDLRWTFTHCFFMNMGGLYFEDKSGRWYPLTAIQVADETNSRFETPTISEDEIKDRSKRDLFTKVVAATQFLQLVLSIFIRHFRKLAFSQLEVLTLTFAVCGIFTYILYFYKPQGVEEKTFLSQEAGPVEVGVSQRENQKDQAMQHTQPARIQFKRTWDSLVDVLLDKDQGSRKNDRIPNDNIPISSNHIAHPAVLALALSSGLFGAMHAIAWNFEFPSRVEQLLWQIATCVAAGSPFVGLVTIPLAQYTTTSGNPDLFAAECLRVLREYTWGLDKKDEKDTVNKVYEKLENALKRRFEVDNPEITDNDRYRSIFGFTGGLEEDNISRRILDFLEDKKRFPDPEKHEKFTADFSTLISAMAEKESKRLNDQATLGLYPRKTVFPRWVNQLILYVTGVLYCLSRLILLGLAFSTLRLMPQSVYEKTPWASFIPVLGSST